MPLQSSIFSTSNNTFLWIRHANLADIPMVFRIESESFNDPYSPHLLMNLLQSFPYGFLVALLDKTPVGYLILRTVDGRGHIIALAVDRRYRGRKVGTKLLEAAVDVFKKRGVSGSWLEVRSSNLGAQLFYQKKGFRRVKTWKGYYKDGEDAEVFYQTISS